MSAAAMARPAARGRTLAKVLAVLAVGALGGCAALSGSTDQDAVLVRESFASRMTPVDNVDSPASWVAPDGRIHVIATAKATDQLIVYDGATGAELRRVGAAGSEPGQFQRPNGVFVMGDLLYVVERDNHRVQVMALPDFRPLAVFGAGDLVKPYGLWVRAVAGGHEVFVTDNYEGPGDTVPPLAELDRRIKRFEVVIEDDRVEGRLAAAFGDTSEAGALRIVESIWGDARNGRLLIAEEDESWASEFKVYGLDGRFAGQVFGRDLFTAQAEGIALVACADGGGYWITTQQGKRRTVFHLFARGDLAPVGSFHGARVANTDGIWFQPAAAGTAFPGGALYAVHDDQGIVGFDWRQVAAALGLGDTCSPEVL